MLQTDRDCLSDRRVADIWGATGDVQMKALNQPRRSETNCFAKKKATAPTTRLAATEAPEPSIARVGPSTSHAARDAMTVAMRVGIPSASAGPDPNWIHATFRECGRPALELPTAKKVRRYSLPPRA